MLRLRTEEGLEVEFRRICDDTSNMGMWELAHNHVFVKNGEAWYRDLEREISEIGRAHV